MTFSKAIIIFNLYIYYYTPWFAAMEEGVKKCINELTLINIQP